MISNPCRQIDPTQRTSKELGDQQSCHVSSIALAYMDIQWLWLHVIFLAFSEPVLARSPTRSFHCKRDAILPLLPDTWCPWLFLLWECINSMITGKFGSTAEICTLSSTQALCKQTAMSSRYRRPALLVWIWAVMKLHFLVESFSQSLAYSNTHSDLKMPKCIVCHCKVVELLDKSHKAIWWRQEGVGGYIYHPKCKVSSVKSSSSLASPVMP